MKIYFAGREAGRKGTQMLFDAGVSGRMFSYFIIQREDICYDAKRRFEEVVEKVKREEEDD